MKKALLFIHVLLLCVFCYAQAPQGFNYQGVARNAAGDPVASKTIKVRLSILDKTASGTAVYSETHNPATNANGLFSTTVGSGAVVTGVFANIDWANGSKFLKSEIDINGGNNFATVATTQMMSVPYALYAQTAGKSSVKTMNDADFELVYNRYSNIDAGTILGTTKGFSGFYELKSAWKNDIFNVVSKLFIDNQLVSTKAGLDVATGNKLGINYNITQFSNNSSFKLVAYFQLENGELYKIEKNLTIPTNKYYVDNDGDNYGEPNSEFYSTNVASYLTSIELINRPNIKLVQIGGDCCDDPTGGSCQIFDLADPNGSRPENIHPGATELANGIDDNCDGQIDEGLPIKTWYRDQDSDGYGGSTSIQSVIDLSIQGYSLQTGDCFDTNQDYINVKHDSWIDANIQYQQYLAQNQSPRNFNPGSTELANGIDDNCNGIVDEGFNKQTWYVDKDGDSFGAGTAILTAFQMPSISGTTISSFKYSLNNTDCNDNNSTINTNAQEIPTNGIDDNCNGVTDECTTDADCPSGRCVGGQCQALLEICGNHIDDNGNGTIDENCLPVGSAGCTPTNCDGLCLNGICQPATCTDNKKNGNETGIDCGGTCPVCP